MEQREEMLLALSTCSQALNSVRLRRKVRALRSGLQHLENCYAMRAQNSIAKHMQHFATAAPLSARSCHKTTRRSNVTQV